MTYGLALAVAAVLLVSGIAKVLLPQKTRLVPSTAVARLLGASEAALAILLLARPLGASSIAVAALSVAFLVASVVSYRRNASCGCFGRLRNRATEIGDIAQAALLTGATSALLILSTRSSGEERNALSLGVAAAVLALWFALPYAFRAPSRRQRPLTASDGRRGVHRRELLLRAGAATAAVAGSRLFPIASASAMSVDVPALGDDRVTTFRSTATARSVGGRSARVLL